MKQGKKLIETVSFLDQWHFLDDIYPENKESVWFVANGKMYVGVYSEMQGAMILADGEGIGLNDVVDWKAVGANRQVASYPREKDIVAAEIPGLPALVMGIFTDHAIDEDTGDEVSGIILDDIYTGLPEIIQWDAVFSWYLLPASPEKRVVIKNISIETPELPVEKEDIDTEEYDNLDGQVDFDGANEEVAEPEIEEAEKPEDLEAEESAASKIKKYAGNEEIKEAKGGRKNICFGTALTRNLDELNKLFTKEDIAKFVKKVCGPYAKDPEQEKYLEEMIRNIYGKRSADAAKGYLYNIILAGEGLRVESKNSSKENLLSEAGRPKGSKNKKTLAAKNDDDDDDDADTLEDELYDDEEDLEATAEQNPEFKQSWRTHNFDEFKFLKTESLPAKARDFAWWWHHELFYSKSDPTFNDHYRRKFITEVDNIFSNPRSYKGKTTYDDRHDVGTLYAALTPEAQEKMDQIVQEWKDLGGVRNRRKITKRAYAYD